MKYITIILMLCLSAYNGYTQDTTSANKVVAVSNKVEFIVVEQDKDFIWYGLKGRKNLIFPDENFELTSHVNAILINKSLATKAFREVFSLQELTLLSKKGASKDNCLSVSVSFNSKGNIFDMDFMMYDKGDLDIRRIITKNRLESLYIKLRSRLQYSMPSPDPELSYYSVLFSVKFSDILLNRPLLTN